MNDYRWLYLFCTCTRTLFIIVTIHQSFDNSPTFIFIFDKFLFLNESEDWLIKWKLSNPWIYNTLLEFFLQKIYRCQLALFYPIKVTFNHFLIFTVKFSRLCQYTKMFQSVKNKRYPGVKFIKAQCIDFS